jgi:hypothetical protein
MAYTPELSREHSGVLRRIAWALELPMTKAIGEVLDHAGAVIDSKKVCRACRDKSFCKDCTFNYNRTKKRET